MWIRRPALSSGIALVLGIGLGWICAGSRTPLLRAGGGDRPDAAIVTCAPIATEINQSTRVQLTSDAVYYLNYSRGFLFAAVPSPVLTGNKSRVLSDFGERDLLKDFQLAPGTTPHFTMTSGTLGRHSEGWAPLYVFETTTGQMVAYRADPQMRADSTAPIIQIVEKRVDARLGRAQAPGATPAR